MDQLNTALWFTAVLFLGWVVVETFGVITRGIIRGLFAVVDRARLRSEQKKLRSTADEETDG